jgi:hypothetical protein
MPLEWTDGSKPGLSSLRDFTVRITAGTKQGTGFFVSPGQVLTCKHVVGETDIRRLKVFWRGSQDPLLIREVRWPAQNVECDLAVIEVKLSAHPCVRLDENMSYEDEIGQSSSFWSFGYPVKRENGDPRTLSYEGASVNDLGEIQLRFKAVNVKEGMSGAPVLNLRNNTVCALISHTLDPDPVGDLGARAVPIDVALRAFQDLRERNAAYHRNNPDAWERRIGSPRLSPFAHVPIDQAKRNNPTSFDREIAEAQAPVGGQKFSVEQASSATPKPLLIPASDEPAVSDPLSAPSPQADIQLDPELQAALAGYLQWMIAGLKFVEESPRVWEISLPMELEDVYVSLRGFEANAFELSQSYELTRTADPDRYRVPAAISDASLKKYLTVDDAKLLNVAEALEKYHAFVVLGDPGCGKTTLARWLALQFACNMRDFPGQEVRVRAEFVDADATRPDLEISLGDGRLPILVPVQEFAGLLANPGFHSAGIMRTWSTRRTAPDISIPAGYPRAGSRIDPKLIDTLIEHYLSNDRAIVIRGTRFEDPERNTSSDPLLPRSLRKQVQTRRHNRQQTDCDQPGCGL